MLGTGSCRNSITKGFSTVFTYATVVILNDEVGQTTNISPMFISVATTMKSLKTFGKAKVDSLLLFFSYYYHHNGKNSIYIFCFGRWSHIDSNAHKNVLGHAACTFSQSLGFA